MKRCPCAAETTLLSRGTARSVDPARRQRPRQRGKGHCRRWGMPIPESVWHADCELGTRMRTRDKLRSTMGLGLLGLGVMAACATALPVVRLQPQGSDIVWVAGRAIVASAHDGIRVAAAFDHQDGRAIAFRIEVANDTAERIDVDPKDMHFAVCISDPGCAGKRKVIDPEQKLLALDHARSQEEADAKNMAVAGT